MKEIRQIKKVVTPSYGSNNEKAENKTLLEAFDSEPGFYQQVVKPLLACGHENELVYLLKSLGLLKDVQICDKRIMDVCCSTRMCWSPSRGKDLYLWKCKECSSTKSIRDDSIFSNMKCSFKDSVRILLGWCKGNDIETMSNLLGIRKSVIAGFYSKAASTAEKFINKNISQWQVGGPGVIVIIDTYPEGCTNSNTRRRFGSSILCITEVQSQPQKYFLETLNRYSRNNSEQIVSLRKHILQSIQSVVVPGSILILPQESTLCSYENFQCLRSLYPTIISIAHLARHNTDQQNLSVNLETIWKLILDICEEAQFYNLSLVEQFIISQMWRRRYGSESFEVLLYQIGLMQ